MIDQSKHRGVFEEALELAGEFVPEFEARFRLTEAILALYRRGWSDGADHILAEMAKLASAARETRETREESE